MRLFVRVAGVLGVLAATAATTPAHAAPQITDWGLPVAGSAPLAIAAGSDGALWFAESAAPGAIGRIDAAGAVTRHVAGVVPGFTPGSAPTAIARGPDGNLWFTVSGGNARVARLTPDGTVTEWPLSQPDSRPAGIAADARDVWFAVRGTDRIGRIGTDGTAPVEFPVSGGAQDIAFDGTGTLWYTATAGPGAIGRMDTSGATRTYTAGLTPNAAPHAIAAGPDNAMWFTEAAAGRIGRIAPNGEITEYPLPDAGSRPTDITLAGDGNLWFTEAANPGRIGRITPEGLVSEYTVGLTANATPTGIATGPDGTVWFTTSAFPGRVGRITVGPAILKSGSGEVTNRSAVLTGRIRPNGQATEYRFEYGSTAAAGARTVTLNAGAGAEPVDVAVPVEGLAPGTTHQFRLVATNATETVTGPRKTFTTAPAAEPGPTAPGAPADAPAAEPAPVHGKTVKLVAGRGRVRVRLPGAAAPIALERAGSIPVGSTIDTTRGMARLTSVDGRGRPQTGRFWGGVFAVRQPRDGRGMVELVLRGRLDGCPRARSATVSAARAGRKGRRLWGRDKGGRFRTRGSNSVATVRGTTWLVEDRCGSTRTKVTHGSVAVRDLRRKQTVIVRAGREYVARARR